MDDDDIFNEFDGDRGVGFDDVNGFGLEIIDECANVFQKEEFAVGEFAVHTAIRHVLDKN